jgi:hypothetical protein
VNADKIRRIFDLNQLVGTHGQDGIVQGDEDLLEYEPQSTNPVYKLIDILLGGTTDTGLDGYVTKFKALLVPFIRSMFIMHIDSELEMDKASNTRPKAVKFQGYMADRPGLGCFREDLGCGGICMWLTGLAWDAG